MYHEIGDGALREQLRQRQNAILRPDLFVKFEPKGCILPRQFVHQHQYISQFPVRDDDVWVISTMKAGTTWTQEMVWMLGHDLNYEGAKVALESRFPFFERDTVSTRQRLRGTINVNPLTTLQRINAMKSPRYIKTHLPLNLLPNQIQTNEKRPKIIYVARNPKDTCVSLYHHRVLIEGYQGTLDELVNEFVSDLTYYAPYWIHVKEFWDRRNEQNVHFITYEQMIKNLNSVVKETASFLGKCYREEQVDSLVAEHLSFEFMKENPATNYFDYSEKLRVLHGNPRENDFIRKGKEGSWKEELSQYAIKKLDEWIEKNKLKGIWKDID